MSSIYSLLIRIYGVLIHVASWFNPKARTWVEGRKQWQEKLQSQIPKNRKVLWFHCASLGEFDQGLPMMKSMKEGDPNLFLLVSFFSPSGMEHYKKRESIVDAACYLPLDTLQNARTFVQIVQPKKAIFVKYEFWPNFLRALDEMQIETDAVSAIFRPSQLYFRWYGGFFRRVLKRIHHFYVQNEESAELLKSIGIQQSTVSGDMRYKRVVQAKEIAMCTQNQLLAAFTSGSATLIIGSSWHKEEEIVRETLSQLGATKLIIAPHDVSEQHISSIQAMFPVALRYTQLTFLNDEKKLFESQILIIDCIGQLSSAYRYGTIAFIGGGFTGNLHNILEPAVYGVPLLFGPKHRKFPEAKLFLEKGFALEVRSPKDFPQAFNSLLEKVSSLRPEIEAFVQAQSY